MCGDIRGAWMRAAYINTRGGATTCPEGLTTYTPGSKRICSSSLSGGGCSPVIYSVYGARITKVCRRALGYQHRDTDAFNSAALLVDLDYTDGLSVTHGTPIGTPSGPLQQDSQRTITILMTTAPVPHPWLCSTFLWCHRN